MAEAAAADEAPEVIPHDLIIAELELALHRAVSENAVLRARVAARDRVAAAAKAPEMPPAAPVPTQEAAP